MKSIIAILALVLLAGCATPQRTVSSATYKDGKVIAQSTTSETGFQLWIGERHDVTSAPGTAAGSDISKATVGALGGAAIGAAAGALAGSPLMGAALGTAAGGISQAVSTPSDAPASGAVSANSVPLLPSIDGAALTPANAGALKAYVAAHPESCRLVGLIGLDRTLALIDQIAAAAPAGK